MNTNILRLFIYSMAIFAVLTCSSAGVTAPAFPTKPITIIVPYPPGGVTDVSSRMIANRATELFGQPVIIINKAGGGGFIGYGEVYNASPDGYTLIVSGSSVVVLAPHLRKAPFDPWKLTPIMSYAKNPLILAVKSDSSWKTFTEFVEFIKKRAGEVKLATTGTDSMENLAMFMIKDQEKLDFKLVPYEGGAPSLASTLGGHTHGFIGVTEAVPYIRDGRMRGLATFLAERIPGLPEIPTLKELGYDVVIESRQVIYGPPGIPKDIVKKLEETFRKAMDSEDFKKVAKSFELIPSYYGSEDLERYSQDLSAKIRTILIKIGRIKE